MDNEDGTPPAGRNNVQPESSQQGSTQSSTPGASTPITTAAPAELARRRSQAAVPATSYGTASIWRGMGSSVAHC